MKTPNKASFASSFSWLILLKSIWYFLAENKFRYVFFSILLFLIFLYDLVPAFIAGRIVDFFTRYREGSSLRMFYFYVTILGVSFTVISVIRLTVKNRLTQIGIMTRTRARILGFERLVNYSLSWHARENTGNKIQRIFDGANALSGYAALVNRSLFPIIVSFIGIIGIYLILSPVFAIFGVIYLTIFLSVQASFNKKISSLSHQGNILGQKASGTYFESSNNILSIKALGSEKNVSARVQKTEENSKDIQIKRALLGTHKWYAFQIFNGIAITVFFLLVGQQVLAKTMTVGEILIFASYFGKLRDAVNDTNETINNLIQYRADLVNMMPIFEDEINKGGDLKFPEPWISFRISTGGFTYPNGHVALADINCQINQGEKLGIIGQSGSGKSTFIKTLLGLYAFDKGSFQIGDLDYYDINHVELLENIAVVLQETELFNLSLKDNITGLRDVDAALIATAIDIAGLATVIEKLPNGILTLVGEKGYQLSGGERQRLGIARAICKNAGIMILDEATSALDSKTEKEVLGKLFDVFGKKKTFVTIAHRISTLYDTDRLLVFDNGTIVEEGTYQELIKNEDSNFGQLYRLQMERQV